MFRPRISSAAAFVPAASEEDDAVGEVATLALPVGPGDRADTVGSLLDGRTETQIGVRIAGQRSEDVGPLGFGPFEDVRIGGIAVDDRTETVVGEALTPVGVPFDNSDLVVVVAEDLSSAAADTAPARQDDVLVHSRAWAENLVTRGDWPPRHLLLPMAGRGRSLVIAPEGL